MTRQTTPVAIASIAAAALVLAGCSSSDPDTAAASGSAGQGATIVATTTIWGDITRQIVECAGAGEVSTLMPIGADPHDYSPSSKDVAAMVGADVVVANGLGLEGGLAESLESAEADGATVLEIAPLLDPLPFGAEDDHAEEEGEEHAEEEEEHAEEGHDHGSEDPHVWHDVARAASAAALIGAEITKATGNPDYAECGTLLEGELMTVHDEVAETLAAVPEDQRILVTDHDALGYLAAAYGYTVAGTVIPGGSTLADPSSAELAELAATVEEAGVPAIFANTANPEVLVEALAAEVGDIEVVALYVDSLGEPGSGADTFQGMVRTNAQLISNALGG